MTTRTTKDRLDHAVSQLAQERDSLSARSSAPLTDEDLAGLVDEVSARMARVESLGARSTAS